MARNDNLPGLLRRGAEGRGGKAALLEKRDGAWSPLSYDDLWEGVSRLALALRRRGISRGDRVAILLPNGPPWIITDLALLTLGAVDVPFYQTLTPAQIRSILSDAGCVAAVVEAGELASNLERASEGLDLRFVVTRGGAPGGGPTFDELLAEGDAGSKGEDGAAPDGVGADEPPGRDDLATIIYTSGTTGTPKGVMLSHGNFMANVVACRDAVAIGPDDVFLSFLPLSHVLERVASHYVGLSVGATVAYAESPDTVVANMTEVRPTIVLAVPRFFEKARARILAAAREAPPLRRRLLLWALRTGAGQVDAMRRQTNPRPTSFAHRLADLLVLRKLRGLFGGRLRFFISGGAALPPDVETFFWGAGFPILQGYGLTETSPVANVNRVGASRPGTVGPPLDGVEIRIGEEGEILVRGANVMKGYWNRPEETAAAIDAEGWLRTGDVGHLTPEGHLVITDRRKDLIVLSTGKNVYPQEVEFVLAQCDWLAQVLVVGDGRPCLGALVVPDFGRLRGRFPDLPSPGDSCEEWMASNAGLRDLVAGDLSRVQESLASYQRVRTVRLLGREFSAEEDEVTPTMKLRRAFLMRRLADRIEALYRADGGAWEIA